YWRLHLSRHMIQRNFRKSSQVYTTGIFLYSCLMSRVPHSKSLRSVLRLKKVWSIWRKNTFMIMAILWSRGRDCAAGNEKGIKTRLFTKLYKIPVTPDL